MELQLPTFDTAALADWLDRLCSVDTTTGREDEGLPALLDILGALGAAVHRQPVAPGRTNVLARWGKPSVLLSTHVDTVAPYLAPRLDGTTFRGRGACDAKGQIVAQLGAVARLLAAGIDDVAWLGVVGEETDSIGAKRALELADELSECRAVIVGEPTALRLASGQRGTAHVRLTAPGRSAHSGTPERGDNAIVKLMAWLERVQRLEPAHDDQLGTDSWSIGTIAGGSAVNVVPARAQADLALRFVPDSTLLAQITHSAPADCAVEVVSQTQPARFPTIDGFAHAIVPFGSDAPWLRGLAHTGTVALVGPGTIDVAHTDDEHLELDDLEAGVALNARLARHFLGTSSL